MAPEHPNASPFSENPDFILPPEDAYAVSALADTKPRRKPGPVGHLAAAGTLLAVSLGLGAGASGAHAETNTSTYRVLAGHVLELDGAAAPNSTFIGQLTVDQADAPGFLSAFPCNEGRSGNSDLNFLPNTPASERYLGKVDSQGDLCIFTSATTHIIVDKNGESSTIKTQRAERKVDTRDTPNGQIAAGGVLKLHLASPNQTVIGQITVDKARAPGFISAYPCNEGQTGASNVNYIANQPSSNRYIGKADSEGNVCFFTLAQTDLIFDQAGALDGSVLPSANAQRYVDTRTMFNGQIQGGNFLRLAGIAGPDQTLFGQLTVDRSRGPGFLSVYPCNQGKSDASDLNFTPEMPASNLLVARADSSGDICVYTLVTTDIMVDKTVSVGGINTGKSVRIKDTRLPPILPPESFPPGAVCNKTAWIEEYVDANSRPATQFAVYDEVTRSITRYQALDLSPNPPRHVAYDVSHCNDPAVLYPAMNPATGLLNIYKRNLVTGGGLFVPVTPDTVVNVDMPDQQLQSDMLSYRILQEGGHNGIRQMPSVRSLGNDVYSYAESDAGFTYVGLMNYYARTGNGGSEPHVKLHIQQTSPLDPLVADFYILDYAKDGSMHLSQAEVSKDGTRKFVLRSLNGGPAMLTEATYDPTIQHGLRLNQVSTLANIVSYDVLGSNIVIANTVVTTPSSEISIKTVRLDLATGITTELPPATAGKVIDASM